MKTITRAPQAQLIVPMRLIEELDEESPINR